MVLRALRLLGDHPEGLSPAEIAQALKANVWPLLDQGHCLPIIDRVFPLAEAAGAHRRMEEGEHVGKIVLKVL